MCLDVARIEPREVASQGPLEGSGVVCRHEDARAAVDHRLAHPAGIDRNDWPTGRLGLYRGDPELLDVWHDQRRGACVQSRELFVRYPPHVLGLLGVTGPEPVELRAVPA